MTTQQDLFMALLTFNKHFKSLSIAIALCAVLGVSGCKTMREMYRHDAAERLAVPANLFKRQIAAGPFSIAVYERVRGREQTANIYIEGDGNVVHVDDKNITGNATPNFPTALHLATRDLNDNVIYIARPCQFEGPEDDKGPCATKQYSGDSRFSLEALDAMNTVLDKLKNRHGLTGFNLIGYDGGGTVATLLAAKRQDILTLRTVAANLDTAVNSANQKTAKPLGGLNPRDFAKDIAYIPQHHFIGQWDKTILPNVSQSFRDAMGPSTCTRISTVGEVDHTAGWVNRWPALLKEPVDCLAH